MPDWAAVELWVEPVECVRSLSGSESLNRASRFIHESKFARRLAKCKHRNRRNALPHYENSASEIPKLGQIRDPEPTSFSRISQALSPSLPEARHQEPALDTQPPSPPGPLSKCRAVGQLSLCPPGRSLLPQQSADFSKGPAFPSRPSIFSSLVRLLIEPTRDFCRIQA